jgi:alginate O-acetyltransferase complex protein AlgJ
MSGEAHTTTTAAGARRGGPTDPSHDEDLRRGILRTTVSRPVARALGLVFLLVVYAVPVAQLVRDKLSGDEPVLLDLFRRAPTRENIRQFEDDLDKASSAREYFRPRMQAVLTRFGGYGNTNATVGRGGWLFYTPGVTAVGGPPFLDVGVLRARREAAVAAGDPPIEPDPRPAILDFARFLAGRGIRLVLFPVPDKASLQPVELHGRARDAQGAPARNPDLPRLEAELAAAGVLVFDPTPAALRRGEAPRFMRQDTHWTPAWMEAVAGDLAALLVRSGEPRGFHAVAQAVSRVGDVTDMLGLPDGQTLFAPRTETIHVVQGAGGAPFEPNEHASVLLLGDSFTNVFSLGPMGWGESAGLAAHLARALDRDVDVIARNDAGAHATRKMLFDALAGGEDRLRGKTAVVWELASRELAVGDWKRIDWASLPPPAPAKQETH